MMLSMPVRLAIALLAGAAVFFIVMAVLSFLRRRSAPRTAQIQAVIAEEERRATAPSLRERLAYWAGSRGYTGTLGPVVLGLSVVYMITSLLLSAFGVPGLAALLAAIPLSWGVVMTLAGIAANKRKAAFDRQLLDGLVMLAGQLEAGVGLQRALRQVQAASAQPFKNELGAALQQAEATRDLVTPMKAMSRRFPSRAFDLFVAAVEIDRDVGGRIEPALKEAAEIMQRDFSIIQEAQAEISQAKSEFYGILILLGFICTTIIGSADPTTKAMYFSPIGVIILTLTGLWVAWGVFRALNIMRAASGLKPAKLGKRRQSRGVS